MRFWKVVYRDRWSGETRDDVVPSLTEDLLRLSFNRGAIVTVQECDGYSGRPLD